MHPASCLLGACSAILKQDVLSPLLLSTDVEMVATLMQSCLLHCSLLFFQKSKITLAFTHIRAKEGATTRLTDPSSLGDQEQNMEIFPCLDRAHSAAFAAV